MPTARPSPPMTATMTADYRGGFSDGIAMAFYCMEGKPNTRAALLEALALAHTKMLTAEAAAE